MSTSHPIRLILDIKDKIIKFSKNCIFKKCINGIQCLVDKGTLPPNTPDSCPKCECVNQHFDIIKHGFKSIRITMPRISNQRTFLDV